MTVGLRQSWTAFYAIALFPLMGVAGFEQRLAVGCAAVSNLFQFLLHTSAEVRLPRWLTAFVMSPAAHRLHHRLDADGRTSACNVGPVFTIWDRVVGTWIDPVRADHPRAYGVVGLRSNNQFTLELNGWVRLLRSGRRQARVWVRG